MESLSQFFANMKLSPDLTITDDGALSPCTSFTFSSSDSWPRRRKPSCRWKSSPLSEKVPKSPDRRWRETVGDAAPVLPFRRRADRSTSEQSRDISREMDVNSIDERCAAISKPQSLARANRTRTPTPTRQWAARSV